MPEPLLTLCETLYFQLNIRIKEPTRYQYRIALADYGRFLSHPPSTVDLDDDWVTRWMSQRLLDGLAAITVRERAGRLQALWTWLAKRRIVDCFPTFIKPRVPEPMPISLTEDELRRFFGSAAKERGAIGGVPAALWCVSFFAFILNTSERKSAALAVEIPWVNLDSATCVIPPGVRKGGLKGATYPLWPSTVPVIRECIAANPRRVHVWPWDKCHESYYTLYNRILRDAGLPVDRKHKTHSLRVTHNTHYKMLTGQHSPLLGHSSSYTSERHYEDKKFTTRDNPQLFAPWERPQKPNPPPEPPRAG
jgi:integrase